MLSLKTRDPLEAAQKAKIYDARFDEFWSALIRAGTAADIQEQYASAVVLARAHGFAYKTVDEIAAAPIAEILQRVNQVTGPETARALLGGASVPKVKLSVCNEDYWGLAIDKTTRKSDMQRKKWENPRRAAMNNLIQVVGDKPINELTRADILAFREWWNMRIKGGLSAVSANKQMRMVRQMIEAVALSRQVEIDCDQLFAKVRFSEQEISRPPFEAQFVQDTLLPGMAGLLPDARLVMMIMADTGARPSEIISRTADDIRLDAEIPFMWIRGDLKTRTSERQIPLVGNALYAFQMKPEGFSERWGNTDSLSNVVNKFMRDNNLLPTPDHSMYSLRHTFKDRLRDIEAPEEIIDDLMGHKKSGPKYGRGHRLETKLKWMQKIAFSVVPIS